MIFFKASGVMERHLVTEFRSGNKMQIRRTLVHFPIGLTALTRFMLYVNDTRIERWNYNTTNTYSYIA